MTDDQFEKLVSNKSVATFITGIALILFGAFMIYALVYEATSSGLQVGSTIFIVVLAALSLFFGVLLVYQQLVKSRQIKTGTHPLIQALRQKDENFVLWTHIQELQFRGQAGSNINQATGKNFQVWAYGRDGKKYILNLARNEGLAKEAVAYLEDKFPGALKGLSPENETLYRNRLAKLNPSAS